MKAIIFPVLNFVFSTFRSRISLKMEVAALRHQLLVYQRKDTRPEIRPADRIFWSWLSRLWPDWKIAIYFVNPATIIAWRRKKFKEHWAKLCRKGKPGRPTIDPVINAFPWDAAPRYLLRDRDKIYGSFFQIRVENMNIKEVKIAPRSPWQSPYIESLIGSIRRECLDHVIVLNEAHLKRILNRYISYYHRYRTHLSLGMDCPAPRSVQTKDMGDVIALPEVGGLHHHYERRQVA